MTAIVVLSEARDIPAMVGAVLSFKAAVLLLWEVAATFPIAS